MKLGKNQEKWLQALESGKFKKGKGRLNFNNEKFCCLGVACELFKNKLNLKKGREKNTYNYNYDGEVSLLPNAVVNYLSLHSHLGDAFDKTIGYSLAEHNDITWKRDKTFKDLVKHIRENAEDYFKEAV